jgi:putative transposase
VKLVAVKAAPTPTHCDKTDPEADARSGSIHFYTLTYKFRLRDRHQSELNRQARAVNFVWNYCNETQQHAVKWGRKWLSGYDLDKLTARTSKELNIHGHTIKRVCLQYEQCRRQHRKAWLRFRGRKSLGWVPFNTDTVSWNGEAFVFRGVRYQPMHTRTGLVPGMKFGAGSFAQDSKGHWYINVPVKVPTAASTPNTRVGIDLGLKTLATLSTGEKIEMPSFYRQNEEPLATLQRARKSKRTRAIHRKIANRRKDYLHKASRKIADTFGLIGERCRLVKSQELHSLQVHGEWRGDG